MVFAVDQFLSTVLGGHPDDTISQRLGRASLAGNRTADLFRVLVDGLAGLAGESDHCVNSLYGSTMVKEIWNWGGYRSDMKLEE